MNKFKFLSVSLAVLIFGSLASCSDDDNDIVFNKPTYVLSEIQCNEDYTKLYYDDQGRFLKADPLDPYSDIRIGYLDDSFTYSGDKIFFEDPSMGYFILGNGLIKTCNSDGLIFSFKYNENRELSSISAEGSVWSSYIWENGLLTSGKEGTHSTFSYYDNLVMNKDAMDVLNALLISECFEDEYPWVMATTGYLGKLPLKPLKSIGGKNVEYGEIDENGCPKSVRWNYYKYNLKWTKL